MPPTPGAPLPPATPRRSGPGDAATQIVENFELKRRQQELESMVRSGEKENSHLRQESSHLQQENSQLRQQNDRARADEEIAIARASTESAQAREEKARADTVTAEMVNVREEAANARAEAARARDETIDARAEAMAARAKLETVEAASLQARARAAAELAREKKAALKVRQEQQVLCGAIRGLAALIPGKAPPNLNPGRRKGRGSATGRGPGDCAVDGALPVLALSRGCDDHGLKFMKGFCKLVSAGTGQDLVPLDDLRRFLVSAFTPRDEEDKDNDHRGAPASTTEPVPRAAVPTSPQVASVIQKEPAVSVCPPPAPGAVATATEDIAMTPKDKVVHIGRPTTIRREQLNARIAQKEREAQRIRDEQERERAERIRDAREKRKQAAARQVASRAGHDSRPTTKSASSPQVPPRHLVHQQQQQQWQYAEQEKKALRAQLAKSKRTKQSVQGTPIKPPRRQQQQQQQVQMPQGSDGNTGLVASNAPVAQPSSVDQGRVNSDRISLPRSVETSASNSSISTTILCSEMARVQDQDEAGVEEVPMPTGHIDGEIFGAGGSGNPNEHILGGAAGINGNRVGGGVHQNASIAAVDAAGVEEEVRATADVPKLEPLVGFVIDGQALGAPDAAGVAEGGQNGLGGGGEGNKNKDSKKKRRRSMRWVHHFISRVL